MNGSFGEQVLCMGGTWNLPWVSTLVLLCTMGRACGRFARPVVTERCPDACRLRFTESPDPGVAV